MAKNIRDEIVAKRQARVAARGFSEGADVPRRRQVPIMPFMTTDGLICEVKRSSPSKGDIAPEMDAVAQASVYLKAGARNLSVLTEPEGFGGSLDDLIQIKREYPRTAVLRKDFLFDTKDIDISWRAGADAVLLISGMLTEDRLHMLYHCAKRLGLEALVEVHDDDDLRKVAGIKPNLIGINSRDLTTFRIDPLLPLRIKAKITWDARVVYESGIHHPEQADAVSAAGFDGLLVGESVVRDPSLARKIQDAMRNAIPARFWPEIAKRLNRDPYRPLIKICGLAREEDALLAADLGADVLGFVFWSGSPRHASPDLVRKLMDVDALKVGVVVTPPGSVEMEPAVRHLLEDGVLDALQLHGDERPEDCAKLWPVNYKALRPANVAELDAAKNLYRCPRILLDAAAKVPGGSGKRVPVDIIESWQRPLWLAGGITSDNVARIAEARRPELLDIASGVEAEPGVKSPERMRKLFKELM